MGVKPIGCPRQRATAYDTAMAIAVAKEYADYQRMPAEAWCYRCKTWRKCVKNVTKTVWKLGESTLF